MTRLACFFAAAAVFALPGAGRAQSLFGSNGAAAATANSNGTASSALNSSRSGSSSNGAQSGQYGNASTGGLVRGSSGGQMGTMGSGGTLGGSQLQSQMNAGDGTLGAMIGTNGFVGRNTTGQFVGGGQTLNQSRGMNLGQQFNQLRNQGSTSRSRSNDSNNYNNFGGTQQRVLVRPQLHLGFESVAVAPPALQSTLQSRLTASSSLGPQLAGVTVTAGDDGKVTLSGVVKSEDDRRMAELLLRLEPGVREVANELRVVP